MELVALLTFTISSIILIFALLTYNQKTGIKIYGDYCLASSSECSDRYVSTVLLENRKDKAVAIFGIYLLIKPNYYIELITYNEKPLILEPFATHQEDFGPIQYYFMNMKKVNLDRIFEAKKSWKKAFIALATSEGKYIVNKSIKRWRPVGDFFKNHYTGWIKQHSIKYQDKFIGSNIKFIVSFKIKEKEYSIFLEPWDYRILKYKNTQFTKESLENKEKLTEYLENAVSEGKIKCDDFTVLTKEHWVSDHDFKEIELPVVNWFQYYILGKISTIRSNLRIKKANRKRK